MAKSLRSKREKRLRAIRREMVEPLYAPKEAAKQAAMEAALAAPKLQLPVRKAAETPIDIEPAAAADHELDVEMEDASQKKGKKTEGLKPMGKKMKKKLKLAKRNCKGKGKLRRRHV